MRRLAVVAMAVFALVVSSLVAVPSSPAFATGTGGITGVVYLGSASKLAGAGEVIVYAEAEAGGAPLAQATTNSAGRYTLTNIPDELVQVYFSYVGSQGYSGDWYGGYSTVSELPDPDILVSQYSINGDRDITLHTDPTVTGVITLGATLNPATNLAVTWLRLDEVDDQYDLPAGTTQTNSSGAFSIVLQSGQYELSYQPPDSSYFSTQTQTLVVDSASISYSYALAKLGTISGRVFLGYNDAQTAGAGQVAITYTCSAQPACQTAPAATTYTDQYGDYSIANLPSPSSGYFNITFTPVNGLAFMPGTLAVDISDASVGAQGNNIDLVPAVILSGTVDLGTSTQPAGADAVTVEAGGYSTETKADGSYSMSVPPGDYEIEFVPTDSVDYPDAWWVSGDNFGVSGQATQVSAINGASNINMILPAAAYISGTITRSDGSPVPTGEQFEVLRDGFYAGDGYTNQYEIQDGGVLSTGPVLPGDYTIEILNNAIDDPLQPTWVGATVDDPAGVRTITVAAGDVLTDADAVQFEDSQLTLNVTCSNCPGEPEASAIVAVQRWDAASKTWNTAYSYGYDLPEYYWPILLPGTYRPVALVDDNTYQNKFGLSFTVGEGQVLTESFTFALAKPSPPIFRTLPEVVTVSGPPSTGLAETPATYPVSSGSAAHTDTIVFGPVVPGQLSPAAAR